MMSMLRFMSVNMNKDGIVPVSYQPAMTEIAADIRRAISARRFQGASVLQMCTLLCKMVFAKLRSVSWPVWARMGNILRIADEIS